MSRMLANALESQTGQDGRLANIWDIKTKGTCENSCFTTADKSPEQNKRLLSADRAFTNSGKKATSAAPTGGGSPLRPSSALV